MRFDGSLQDLGSKSENVAVYDLSYVGADLEALRAFVVGRCEEKGVEVLQMSEGKEKGGMWKVSARVKSLKGIV